jgi:hypothetical protein
MDYATRFVLHLKSYFDTIPQNVWSDFERNLRPDRKWDEDSILRSSILRDGFDQSKWLREANGNPVYNLSVKIEDYGGTKEETLTGADLAMILRLQVNKTLVTQRVVLVQLKRAFFQNGKTVFPTLHHESGARCFGRDFHQAQRMLFFSTTPVYWFASTSGILADQASLAVYSEESSLRNTLRRASTLSEHADHQGGSLVGPLPLFQDAHILDALASMSSSEIEECLEFWEHYYPPLRRFWRHLRKPAPSALARNIQHARDNLPFGLYATLRTHAHEHAFDNFGMAQRIGLFVCNAEDVFTLSHVGQHDFAALYKRSIPFTQFMLQHLVGSAFGDANEKLANAILSRDVSGYFRDRVQQVGEQFGFQVPDGIEQSIPVRSSIVLALQVRTQAQQEG